MFSKNTPTQCLYVHTLVHCSVVIAARFGRLLFSLGWRRMCVAWMWVCACVPLSLSHSLYSGSRKSIASCFVVLCVRRYVSVCMLCIVCACVCVHECIVRMRECLWATTFARSLHAVCVRAAAVAAIAIALLLCCFPSVLFHSFGFFVSHSFCMLGSLFHALCFCAHVYLMCFEREHLATPHIIVRQNYVDIIICMYTFRAHTRTHTHTRAKRREEQRDRTSANEREMGQVKKGTFIQYPIVPTRSLSLFASSLAQTFVHLIRSFVRLFVHSFVCLLTRSFNRLLARLFVCLFRSFVQIHSPARSFVRSLAELVAKRKGLLYSISFLAFLFEILPQLKVPCYVASLPY